MASRIEFEKEWLSKLNRGEAKKGNFSVSKAPETNNKKQPIKQKALSNVASEGLKGVMNNFFD
jgi:hypothetical protein